MMSISHDDKSIKGLLPLIIIGLVLISIEIIFALSPQKSNAEKLNYRPDRSTTKMSDSKNFDYVPGEVLIKFKEGTTEQQIEKILAGIGYPVKRIGPKNGKDIYLIKLKPGISAEEAIKNLEAQGLVKYAEPNFIIKLQSY